MNNTRPLFAVAVAMLLLVGSTAASAQVVNAGLSGTVTDTTGALIPGVDVTARNTDTGVESVALTNETGTYRFASLQPGPYDVSASLPGFQTQTFRLNLGTSQQIRQNFSLAVGQTTTEVEVTIAADELLTAASPSVGDVLALDDVVDLPLVGRNVLDFAQIIPGVVGNGGTGTTFAGINSGGSGNVNIQLDGVTMNNGRHAQGITAATTINPDMIEELRVVVAAVDVEARGSAQVQARTRSGTNEYHGALVWNARNSALNANSWSNNRQGIDRTWYNRHQYTASVGGPIFRNKTFFFVLFDGQDGAQKQTISTTVLTDTARQGIFRYFPGVNNGNADATPSGTGNNRIAPVVDLAGNALDWTQIPGATGPMRSFSVFGDAMNPGDPNRTGYDSTGFIQRLLTLMPKANAFNGGDGLNTAVHRWTRRTIAGGAGTGADPDAFRRRQINIKIDHNFNQDHKLTGSYIKESRYSDNNALSPWPNGWGGEVTTKPNVITLQLTSALTPNLLNEFKYGRRVTTLRNTPAYHHSEHGDEAYEFMTVNNGMPVMQHPVLFQDHMIACAGNCTDFGNSSPLDTFTNTMSWVRGTHGFKFGVEFRFASTNGWAPNVVLPHAYGGAGNVPVRGIDQVPGLLNSNITLAQNLLLSLAGSVDYLTQRFETREPTDTRFLDFRDTYFHPDNPPNTYGRIRDWHQNEFNFFVKDDWQVSPNLTLNLGLRYDLMRVPYLLSASGQDFTPGLLGGNESIFGYSGRSIDAWMAGGSTQQADLTSVVLIGKGTPYPDQGIWKSDKNNFAPAVGFAWSPSWFGQDKTTVRGGYQITYQLPGNSLSWIDFDVGNYPGFTYEPDFTPTSYTNFANMQFPIPVNLQPFQGAIPVTERAQNITVFDTEYTTPYVQTFTLGVTRSLASNLTLDVRYIGTKGTKLHGSINLNDADFRNNGIFEALEATRAGQDHPMFDQMLGGLNIGSGVVGQTISGSEALRRHPTFRTNIANGDFVQVARDLNRSNLGTVQPDDEVIFGGLLRSSGLFPENFFVVNPQFNTVTYRTNADRSNYHSLQTQVTLRPTHGVTYQGTYTWSKSLGVTSNGLRDLRNWDADYSLNTSDRTHAFRSYGTFQLPFGPNQLVGGASNGWVARVIEGWELGMIFNMTSGAPMNVGSRRTLYAATGTPDIVGDFPRDGSVVWGVDGSAFGNYFAEGYQRVTDPGCLTVASNLRTWCTNTALADADGNIVLRNAAPGQLGTLGLTAMEGPGTWDLDMNLQKSVRIDESKSVTVRLDASNIFNHPTPGNPSLSINGGTFGQITTKTGSRVLQAQLRFDF